MRITIPKWSLGRNSTSGTVVERPAEEHSMLRGLLGTRGQRSTNDVGREFGPMAVRAMQATAERFTKPPTAQGEASPCARRPFGVPMLNNARITTPRFLAATYISLVGRAPPDIRDSVDLPSGRARPTWLSRRMIDFMAASASISVESTATVSPFGSVFSWAIANTVMNTRS